MLLSKCRSVKSYGKEKDGMTQNEVFHPGSRKYGKEKSKREDCWKKEETVDFLASTKHK